MRRGLVLLMAIWIVLGNALAAAPVMAQSADTSADVAIVSRVVRDLSRAEQRQDYNMLYDLMLPDARRLVPRQAMLNWYESEETLVPTEDPVVASVTFGEYEYPLTGEVYDNVATVTYTQQGELGGVAEEEELVLHLWHDGQTWRWFFDGTERQVDRIARRTETLLDYHSPYATEAYQQIDAFWAQLFANAGREYVAPVDMVGVRVEPTETGCGMERDISAMLVYYCTLDQTIYYDPDFRDMVTDAGGDYAWYTIIAHEWGHHVQNLLGIDATMDPELDGGFYPIELELQADCMAGMYGQDAFARGLIDDRDTRAAARVTDAAGDLDGTSWDDPSAHGTGEQREQSFWTGFDDGLRGCNLDLVNPGQNENGWHS
ncbi:MAG TPA: neutral zinc metallopeptidase [Thermomicrobiales bacterium]|nr:neutral zinc metallopeptidase [Thermomicrobiales bacterium]